MRPCLLVVLAVLAALGVSLVSSAGCRPAPDEAPTELDELVHFFFLELDGGEADLLGEGADNVAAWYGDADDLDDGMSSGQVSDLDDEEITTLEEMAWEPDPSLAVGVYTLSEVPCTYDQMIEIFLEADQMVLFPDNYEDYERWLDSDDACFRDGSCDVVDYHSRNTDKLVGFTMEYTMYTRMRRFHYIDVGGSDAEFLLVRNYMPEPAEENINGGAYEQSYMIEAHMPRDGGQILHLYALWNYGYLDGISDDLDFWPNQYLDGLMEHHEQLEVICRDLL
jgi:hypothetical protein